MKRRQLYRDGFLAAATCGLILLGALFFGVDVGVFVEPIPAGVGCVGMASLEVLLLRNPDLTRRVWNRPAVQVGSVLGVLVGGGVAVSLGVVWVVSVLVWGLLAYVGLVCIVLVRGRNPLARIS